MKKLIALMFALALSGSLYAGGGCCSKKADKDTEAPSDKEVVVTTDAAESGCDKDGKESCDKDTAKKGC